MQILKKSLAMGVTAAALSLAAPAMADDVKLGFLGGFTGPAESLMPPIFNGTKLAVAAVNENGGIVGGQLSIVSADAACEATAASNAADRLVNTESVVAMVGGICSSETISGANNSGIPGNVVMISPSSTAPTLTTMDDNDLVFRVVPSDAFQGVMLAKLLLSKGINELVITYKNDDYGKGLAGSLADAYTSMGGTVAANESHEEGKADYRAELGSLAASGVQNLAIIAFTNGSGQTILRQAVESGDFTTYIGGDGMVGDEVLIGIDAASVEGMIATKPGTPDVPGATILSKIMTDAGMDPTAIYAAQAYDATFMLALAIEKNGSSDRQGVSAALRAVSSAPGETILPGEWEKAKKLIADGKDINYEGASGSFEFDAAGDVPGVIIEMAVKGGKFVEVGQID